MKHDDNKLSNTITESVLGSRESCEDKDAWDDFNKALTEEVSNEVE